MNTPEGQVSISVDEAADKSLPDIRGEARGDIKGKWRGRNLVLRNVGSSDITAKVVFGNIVGQCAWSKKYGMWSGDTIEAEIPQNLVGVCFVEASYGLESAEGADSSTSPIDAKLGASSPATYWHYNVDKKPDGWIFSFSTPPASRKVRVWTGPWPSPYSEFWMSYGDSVKVLDGQWMQGLLDDGSWTLLTDVDRR